MSGEATSQSSGSPLKTEGDGFGNPVPLANGREDNTAGNDGAMLQKTNPSPSWSGHFPTLSCSVDAVVDEADEDENE